MPISDVSRRAIIDEFATGSVNWAGRFEEPAFLARLYDMEELPSKDYRYRTAYQDVHQHRVNNLDWEDDWVFYDDRFDLLTGDDETFLRFLAETVHPALRRDPTEVGQLVAMYNEHLRSDGYELAEIARMSGRPVFAGRSRLKVPRSLHHVERTIQAGNTEYLAQQITRMEASIESDPELAIGTAKELVETCCKTILHALGIEAEKEWDLPRLLKETSKQLKLSPDMVSHKTAGGESVRRVLGNLASIVGGIAELRNLYGTGHGKRLGSEGLGPRHARLAVGAASTLAIFLFETYQEQTP